MSLNGLVSDDELRQHHCLERVDLVPGDPETTAFKRRARLHQANWREHAGFKIGTQPMRPTAGRPCRILGSRLDLAQARESRANFLDDRIRAAVQNRLDHPEPHQTLNEDRLFCDLLSSMPMCFNVFGHFHDNFCIATDMVRCLWPDAPGPVSNVRFEWSPGRRRPGEYLENRSAFDVAFELTLADGSLGVIGVETKYHERCKAESVPGEDRLRRYKHVSATAGVFTHEAMHKVTGTHLQQIWLDHLLALSMLQHTNPQWKWVKFVLVHPERNPSYARAAESYRALLKDSATFEVCTIESVLAAMGSAPEVVDAFRKRYLW